MLRRSSPDVIAAWGRRSKPLNRGSSELSRGAGLAIHRERYETDRRVRGSTLRQRAKVMAGYYEKRRVPLVRRLVAEAQGRCAAADALASTGTADPVGCWGPLTVHERRRRSDGGSLEPPAGPANPTNLVVNSNLIVVCAFHNQVMGDAHAGDVWHQHRLVVLRGDADYADLKAERGERRKR